jgi:heme/copper-type cytochrome/quinol oxidase subunit 3
MSSFNFSDSAYGSIFFMATGFHGFHVILGTSFLTVCFIRLFFIHYNKKNHLGLEFAI